MFTVKASNLSGYHLTAAACKQWYNGSPFHRRDYCNADYCDCLKISPWLTILFFLFLLSLKVKWGLHLTAQLCPFLSTMLHLSIIACRNSIEASSSSNSSFPPGAKKDNMYIMFP